MRLESVRPLLPAAPTHAAVTLILVLGLTSGCGGSLDAESTTTTQAATTTTTVTSTSIAGRAGAFGYARDWLTAFDATDGGLGRVFAGDQPQAPEVDEVAYIEAVRAVEATAGGETIDWSRWADDDLVFFGYLYCLVAGNGSDPETGVGNVTAEVSRLAGETGYAPIHHFATAVHIVNLASGGLCGEFYVPTRAYLESLQ